MCSSVSIQSVAKVLYVTLYFFPLPRCIDVRLPLPTPNTIFSFIHLTLRIYFNVVVVVAVVVVFFRGGGGCKMKNELLKSKDFVMERE